MFFRPFVTNQFPFFDFDFQIAFFCLWIFRLPVSEKKNCLHCDWESARIPNNYLFLIFVNIFFILVIVSPCSWDCNLCLCGFLKTKNVYFAIRKKPRFWIITFFSETGSRKIQGTETSSCDCNWFFFCFQKKEPWTCNSRKSPASKQLRFFRNRKSVNAGTKKHFLAVAIFL